MKHNKKLIFQTVALIMMCVLVIPLFTNVKSNAADIKYIRVGLRSLYDGVEQITIHNESVGIGYCIDNGYTINQEFDSSNGFTITPMTKKSYISSKQVKDYSLAKTISGKLNEMGVKVYPVITGKNSWSILLLENESGNAKEAVDGRFGFEFGSLTKDNGHRLLVTGSRDSFIIDGTLNNGYPQFIAGNITSPDKAVVNLGSRSYRGRIEIGRYNSSKLTAVNVVNIEHYLYGVIPAEVPSSWHMEVLKTQAVSARGYAIRTAGYNGVSNLTKAYIMGDTASSQVYKGYQFETTRTNAAVNQTAGQVMKYDGQIITTYFSSTSGGSTENVEDVWSRPIPYLRSVPDLYETQPAKDPWVIHISKNKLLNLLKSNGYQLDSVRNMYGEITTSSGRIMSLRIQGNNKFVVLQKTTIRSILSVPSSKFKIVKYGDTPDLVSMEAENQESYAKISDSYVINGNYQVNKVNQGAEQYFVMSADNITNYPRITPDNKDTYLLAGQGFGHGVGMSQSGARGMAEAGYTYKEILEHYFSGASLVE